VIGYGFGWLDDGDGLDTIGWIFLIPIEQEVQVVEEDTTRTPQIFFSFSFNFNDRMLGNLTPLERDNTDDGR
jgi:hypothetical protein